MKSNIQKVHTSWELYNAYLKHIEIAQLLLDLFQNSPSHSFFFKVIVNKLKHAEVLIVNWT